MEQQKTTRKVLLTALLLCGAWCGNQAVGQTAPSKYITQEMLIPDTMAVRNLIYETKQKVKQQKIDFQRQKDNNLNIRPSIFFMLKNLGQKVQTDIQRQLLNEALENYGKTHPKTKISKTGVFALGMLGVYVGNNSSNSLYDNSPSYNKVAKKVKKGIIDPALRFEIARLDKSEDIKKKETIIQEIESDNQLFEKTLEGTLSYPDSNYVRITVNTYIQKPIKVVIGSTDKLENYVNVNGTKIANQNSWLWQYYHNVGSQRSMDSVMTKGWEWANDPYKLETKHISYPTSVNYSVSAEHPEYAIVDNVVYTKEGKLVRVLKCSSCKTGDLYNYLYIKDYKANKYNIKEKDAETQSYIQRHLGLTTTRTAKEKARDAKAVKAAEEIHRAALMKRTARTQAERVKAERASRKASISSFTVMDSFFDYNGDGMRYLDQLKQDHVNEFSNAYYYERIDNTSFILKYTGPKTIYTVKVTYTQDKPFSVKETAKILSEESINADDFKETHEGIRLPI